MSKKNVMVFVLLCVHFPLIALSESLERKRAIEFALEHNLQLKSENIKTQQWDSEVLQANASINPEISLDVENIMGSGELKGVDSAEVTLQLSQEFELGGKLQHRRSVADAGKEIQDVQTALKKKDITYQVSLSFIDVLVQQHSFGLGQELLALNQALFEVVQQRVQADQVLAVEENKAKLLVLTARMDLKHQESQLRQARRTLSSFWGETHPQFSEVTGNLETTIELPNLHSLLLQADQSLQTHFWEQQLKREQSLIDLEKSQSTSNLKLSAGIRSFQETSDQAFVLGISMPLNVSNNNSGNIQKATQQLSLSQNEREQSLMEWQLALRDAYEEAQLYSDEIIELQKVILPGLRETFEATKEGYQHGRFAYLEVLDTQKKLFEMKQKYFLSLKSYYHALADLEKLTTSSFIPF